ncbi:hypothetical protein CBS101457_004559 [Exobasidium rhododendri]|nr:hypothetical protein CBS101457_004559 [Exobasidium rhododendri]
MPGRGRLNHGAITLPSQFDYFATHPDIDWQWASNETVGQSDHFIESMASIQNSSRHSQRSPSQTNEVMRGPRLTSPHQGMYTRDLSELRQPAGAPSPALTTFAFDPASLLADVQAVEDFDLGLEIDPIGDDPTDALLPFHDLE